MYAAKKKLKLDETARKHKEALGIFEKVLAYLNSEVNSKKSFVDKIESLNIEWDCCDRSIVIPTNLLPKDVTLTSRNENRAEYCAMVNLLKDAVLQELRTLGQAKIQSGGEHQIRAKTRLIFHKILHSEKIEFKREV